MRHPRPAMRAQPEPTEPDSPSAALRTAEDAPPQQVSALPRGTPVGRYLVLGRLGAGGMGVVYEAYDPDLERRVALKLLPAWTDTDRGGARLLREAQAMARLSHPNVIAVYDVGRFADGIFIAMEFVDGQTLAQWMREPGRPRGWREVISVFRRAGEGLAAAHAAGVVHRDFKPENVLLARSGKVKVTDFGLARGTHEVSPSAIDEGPAQSQLLVPLTRTGGIMGTLAYMAPEQHDGGRVDPRTDQFAFCVALYEALYGKRPFHANARGAWREVCRTAAQAVPPAGIRVPGRIRRALYRGMSAAPGERFPSMDSLLQELAVPTRLSARRGAAAGSAALVVALSVGAWVQLRRHRAEGCREGTHRVEALWSPERRAQMAHAFAAAAPATGAVQWARAQELVGGYFERWARADEAACTATRVARTASEDELALKQQCLGRKIEQAVALARLFEDADAEIVSHAVRSASELPPLAGCEDLRALAFEVKPPPDEQTRAAVAQLRPRIAELAALTQTGHYPRSAELAASVVEKARALGYRPALAEALYEQGRAQQLATRYSEAEKTLLEAAWTAEASRHDTLAAQARVQLVKTSGTKLGHREEALQHARHAQASIERLGGNPDLQASLHAHLGGMYFGASELDDAEREFKRALAVQEANLGPEDPALAGPIYNLALISTAHGRHGEALPLYQRALKLAERSLGAEHPDVATLLTSMAQTLSGQGRYEEAIALLRRSKAIQEKYQGRQSLQVASALLATAQALFFLGRYEEALPAVTEAIAIRETALGKDHPSLAFSYIVAGDVAREQGRLPESRRYYERALALRTQAYGENHVEVGMLHSRLGVQASAEGHPREALASFERAIALLTRVSGPSSPKLADPYRHAGAAQLELHQPRAAMASFEAARKIQAEDNSEPANRAEVAFGVARAELAAGASAASVAQLLDEAEQLYLSAGEAETKGLAALRTWRNQHRVPASYRTSVTR